MIKTRFAPSPTGYLHIGSLRTALYNYLFAKQNKGIFMLRIEDTDQKREVSGALESLIQTLQKMGLNWDEGPVMDKDLNLTEKGQFGPYLQSNRLKIYHEQALKLVKEGKAYYCTCSPERLAQLRTDQEAKNEAPRYDGHCRDLEIKAEKPNGNQPFVIRLKIPQDREVVFNDVIRGEVKFKSTEIDDQVLIKSDGYPTYHLANVVDDHLMEVTNVVRGEEWLPSTPKHILLYEAFGWQAPQFAHLPLLLNADKSKLSKRQGDVAVEDYLAKGYLPEALINYVALLGWHPNDNNEIFSLADLVKHFNLNKVQKGGAIFDVNKLNWFNCYYIKQLPEKELLQRCAEFLPN
ncbi:MAG: glutamate--tRNA ligase, partial [Patescibacteria group bacterium]